MSKIFEWDEDLNDFFPNPSNTSLYKLFDYETVTALLKVSTFIGCKVIQTKIDIFYNDNNELDESLYELIEDEPIYLWNGDKEFTGTGLKILKVYEILEWSL